MRCGGGEVGVLPPIQAEGGGTVVAGRDAVHDAAHGAHLKRAIHDVHRRGRPPILDGAPARRHRRVIATVGGERLDEVGEAAVGVGGVLDDDIHVRLRRRAAEHAGDHLPIEGDLDVGAAGIRRGPPSLRRLFDHPQPWIGGGEHRQVGPVHSPTQLGDANRDRGARTAVLQHREVIDRGQLLRRVADGRGDTERQGGEAAARQRAVTQSQRGGDQPSRRAGMLNSSR